MLNVARHRVSRALPRRRVGVSPTVPGPAAIRQGGLSAHAGAGSFPPPMTPATPSDVEIRDFALHADYAACVALQREIWGLDFGDVVPPSILKVTQRLGGIAAGAFGRDGALLGFVYGLTGLRDGRVVHWSDMLAVRPGLQNLGLGRRLKEHQRAAVRALGIDVIYWTYDPLVARNAHLNLAVLGARVVEYVEDMYGDTGSALHRGVGTDRFVVAWPTDPARAAEAAAGARASAGDAAFDRAPVANAAPGDDAPRADVAGVPRMRVVIPGDLARVQATAPELAPRWRASTREALRTALANGYEIVGVRAEPESALGWYLLARRA